MGWKYHVRKWGVGWLYQACRKLRGEIRSIEVMCVGGVVYREVCVVNRAVGVVYLDCRACERVRSKIIVVSPFDATRHPGRSYSLSVIF